MLASLALSHFEGRLLASEVLGRLTVGHLMGNVFYLGNGGPNVGDMSKGRWREMRRLLPLFLHFINSAMKDDWRPGVMRSVVVFQNGSSSPSFGKKDSLPPTPGTFEFARLIRDLADDTDEVFFEDQAELVRLISWCDFLESRDGAFLFYKPVADALRHFASSGGLS